MGAMVIKGTVELVGFFFTVLEALKKENGTGQPTIDSGHNERQRPLRAPFKETLISYRHKDNLC